MRSRRMRLNRESKLITHNKLSLFSESSLVILISIVTLFLQAISFVTTWNGSKVYLEGVFPYASLLFALAIQLTAYFLSNSLRTKITLMKVLAMAVALCCSTYYSYIGIYNSVNSPVSFLQQNYMRIADELTEIYDSTLEEELSHIRLAIGEAYSQVNAKYSSLEAEKNTLDSCSEELADAGTSYSQGMRAPKQSSYETYEEYAAAYQAYIAAISSGKKTEKETLRADILSSYGFTGINELNQAKLDNAASVSMLYASLGIAENGDVSFSEALTSLYLNLSATLDNIASGQLLDEAVTQDLTKLFQTASLCSDHSYDIAAVKSTMDLSAKSVGVTVIANYQTLVSLLPEGMVTSANTMTLKGNMDSQIISAIISLNSILPESKQISLTDSRYQITDLYLIPIKALTGESTRTTAFFCLAVAALIDGLSVLFAISVRKRKPIWTRPFLLYRSPEEYRPQICAALPEPLHPIRSLGAFLSWFYPSPETECDGYMMKANMNDLGDFYPLTALLCQINLAKVVPAGLNDNDSDIILLRARFVFWANELIYENIDISKEVTE